MRARRAVAAAMAAVLAWGGTAYGDGSPVAGVAVGGPGVTWGSLRYVALATHGGTAVAQINRATGEVNGYAALRGGWGIPLVAFDGTTAGISAGGHTLVLARNSTAFYPNSSRFAIVDPLKMRLRRIVTLHGAFSFDAVSPDGRTMYLIQRTSRRDLLRYSVRAYDLGDDRLVPGAIVDKTEPDERMAGMPMARATTPDGVWAYTLYYKPTGRLFVHALNTQAGSARCIDLPRFSTQDMPRLAVDGGRLDVVTTHDQVLAAVDRSTFALKRSPAPVATRMAPPKPQSPARKSSGGAPLWVVVPAVLLLAGLALLAVRRRRPTRGGRSGGAAAGAPSGP